MPHSYPYFKEEVKNWILDNISQENKILDVGPGEGTYADLLNPYGYTMDCIEIWEPYIKKYKLKDKYEEVYNEDILDATLTFLCIYGFVIMGDVLEHLPTKKAQILIHYLCMSETNLLVAVPYKMEQGEYDGNIHETHLQADLTPEVMKERYPTLKLLYGNDFYGYYIRKQLNEKAYVLYADESYMDIAISCCKSIRKFSKIPIYLYLLLPKDICEVDDYYTEIEDFEIIEWESNIRPLSDRKDFIKREDKQIYKILIERPKIIKHALENYAETVAYIDTDSIATEYVDTIFDYFKADSDHPYFVEGIYDYLHLNGRGGAETREDMSTTLEAPICELFSINQYVRQRYRQTGYFVAGQNCIDWIDEWAWMCQNPKVINNHAWYAPFHEETIANALLWKYNQFEGLPYIYINGLDNEFEFKGFDYHLKSWVRIPANKEKLLFYHGEKDIEKINKFIDENTISSTAS
jgi:hypothetical protein